MPTIWAFKELIKYSQREGKLWAIFDLHSHTTKRGIFFFSNPLKENTYKAILRIPYLFHMNQKDFKFNKSNFGIENIESSSRKYFYRKTNRPRIYTVESNYWGGDLPFEKLKKKGLIKDNLRIIKDFANFYRESKFNEIGANLAKATALDRVFYQIDNSKEIIKDESLIKLRIQVIDDIKKHYSKLSKRPKKKKNKQKKMLLLN